MKRYFVEFNYKCITSDNKKFSGENICMTLLCKNKERLKIELEKCILEDFLLDLDIKDLTIDIINVDLISKELL